MNKYEKQALFDGAKEFLNDDLLSKLMCLVAQIEGAQKETPGNEELTFEDDILLSCYFNVRYFPKTK